MVRLTRTVRFAVGPSDNGTEGPNGYAGVPSMVGLGSHYELQVSCVGNVDRTTSYLLDIKTIDKAVRSKVIPIIRQAALATTPQSPQQLLAAAMPSLGAELGNGLESVRWFLTPYYSIEMSTKAQPFPAPPPTGNPPAALLRQRFDFAAAHRLHIPGLSEEQNRAMFGKCNYPGGHGHNYQLEPCVEVGAGAMFTLQELERLVQRVIIEPFDHRHLNQTDAFCIERGGLNPTVENIARVFFELLSKAVEGAGAKLRSVTVWETDRTSATYPA